MWLCGDRVNNKDYHIVMQTKRIHKISEIKIFCLYLFAMDWRDFDNSAVFAYDENSQNLRNQNISLVLVCNGQKVFATVKIQLICLLHSQFIFSLKRSVYIGIKKDAILVNLNISIVKRVKINKTILAYQDKQKKCLVVHVFWTFIRLHHHLSWKN